MRLFKKQNRLLHGTFKNQNSDFKFLMHHYIQVVCVQETFFRYIVICSKYIHTMKVDTSSPLKTV